MPRCSCAGSSCNCLIEAGDGIEVEGLGTADKPYVVSAVVGDIASVLSFDDTADVVFTVTGDGTPSDQMTVTATTPRKNLPVFPTGGLPDPSVWGEGAQAYDSTLDTPVYSDGSAWQAPAGGGGSTPDATTSTKGKVKLAGDLAGTADAPTVPALTNLAPKASPAFTGTPTVPTAPLGTDTTQAASTEFVQNEIDAIPSVTSAFLGILDGEIVRRWEPSGIIGAELWRLDNFFYAHNVTDLTPELVGTGTNQTLRTSVSLANISNQDRSFRVQGEVVVTGGVGVYGQSKLRVGLMYSSGSVVPGTSYQLAYAGQSATYPIEFDVSMEKVDAGGVVWLDFRMEMSNGVAAGVGSFTLQNMSVKEIAEIQPVMQVANSGESPALYTPAYDPENRTWKMHRTYFHPDGALNDIMGTNSSRIFRYPPVDPYLLDAESTSLESEWLEANWEFMRSLRVGNNDQIFIVKRSTGDYELRGNVHGGESVRAGAGNLKYEYDVKGDGTWTTWDGTGILLRPCRKFRYTYNTQLVRSAPDSDVFAHVNHVCTFYPDGVMRMDRTTTFQTNTKLAGHLEWMSSHNLETPALGRIGNGLIVQNEVDVFPRVERPAQPTLTPATSGGSLAAGTYKYVVTALAEGGETDASVPQTAVVASGTTGQVTVAWTAVTDAQGYRIYGRANGNGTMTLLATVGKVTSWVDTGANPPLGELAPTRNRARKLSAAETRTHSAVSGTASWATWYDPIVGLCMGNIYDRDSLTARPNLRGVRVRLERGPGIRKNYIDTTLVGDNSEIYGEQETRTIPAGTVWTATHWSFTYAPSKSEDYHLEIAARAADLSLLKQMYPA